MTHVITLPIFFKPFHPVCLRLHHFVYAINICKTQGIEAMADRSDSQKINVFKINM